MNKKRILLIIAILILIIVTLSIPSSKKDIGKSIKKVKAQGFETGITLLYFPFTALPENYDPYYHYCEGDEKRGIAWGYGSTVQEDTKTLCASRWMGRFQDRWVDLENDPIIPVIKTGFGHEKWWENAIKTIPSNWNRPLIIMNEPNIQTGQTADLAAEQTCEAREIWPEAELWIPNITGGQWATKQLFEGWMYNYLVGLYEHCQSDIRPFRWAIHHYSVNPNDIPTNTINRFCTVVRCNDIVMSEYGLSWQSQQDMKIWTRALHNDDRVLLYFGFTNNDDNPDTTWEMIDEKTGAITPYGLGFVEGGGGSPPYP